MVHCVLEVVPSSFTREEVLRALKAAHFDVNATVESLLTKPLDEMVDNSSSFPYSQDGELFEMEMENRERPSTTELSHKTGRKEALHLSYSEEWFFLGLFSSLFFSPHILLSRWSPFYAATIQSSSSIDNLHMHIKESKGVDRNTFFSSLSTTMPASRSDSGIKSSSSNAVPNPISSIESTNIPSYRTFSRPLHSKAIGFQTAFRSSSSSHPGSQPILNNSAKHQVASQVTTTTSSIITSNEDTIAKAAQISFLPLSHVTKVEQKTMRNLPEGLTLPSDRLPIVQFPESHSSQSSDLNTSGLESTSTTLSSCYNGANLFEKGQSKEATSLTSQSTFHGRLSSLHPSPSSIPHYLSSVYWSSPHA